jgi:tRNA(fMet)-specific endonuclease VapC
MILLDTDHFSVVVDARHARHARLVDQLRHAADPVVLPVIAVEEQLRAWLAQVRRIHDVKKQVHPYDRMIRLVDTLRQWDNARWTESAADTFMRLRSDRIRIGTQDLKIASIALANDATLLSANLRDFEKVPGLRVEDWLSADL